MPARDCHIPCAPHYFERSRSGLPYPRLEVFAQSLIDTKSLCDLEDLIDGMDLTEKWGQDHLDLTGTNDASYAK